MDHTTMLNLMLANACSNPADVPWREGVKEYNFEAHCAEFTVWARVTPDPFVPLAYDVYQIKVTA